MPPESVARLAELAQAGGHVIFVERVPEGAPGLVDSEARAAAFRTAMERLRAGRTTLVADATAALARLREVLAPDFRIEEPGDGGAAARRLAMENVGFVHRRDGEVDYYFVANVSEHRHDLRVRFAVGHRKPERWDPETGAIDATLVYEYVSASGGEATEVALHLEPFESCYLAFGDSVEPPLVTHSNWVGPLRIARRGDRVEVEGRISANRNYELTLGAGRRRFTVSDLPKPVHVTGPWTLALGDRAPFELQALRSWTELPEGQAFSGWGRYEIAFEAPTLTADVEWLIDLGAVHETAEVTLNGQRLGAAWKAPRRLACGAALRPGRNLLIVEVANLWIHAMVAREPPPEWKDLEEIYGIRWGRYGEVPPETIPPSGLLGPVHLLPRKRLKLTL
jgi:hypothetical protein